MQSSVANYTGEELTRNFLCLKTAVSMLAAYQIFLFRSTKIISRTHFDTWVFFVFFSFAVLCARNDTFEAIKYTDFLTVENWHKNCLKLQ